MICGGGGGRLVMVVGPHRWLVLRWFRDLCECGAVSLSEIA